MLINYILNNNLYIDKGTYITVVIGQTTIYGILLTFYQFIASLQGGNKDSITKYLGVGLTEYFVKKRISIYNRIVSKPFFFILFMAEILLKPFICIFGGLLSNSTVSVLYFAWFAFVVFYFAIFIVLFFQCTKCVLLLKKVSDAKVNGWVIRSINNDFLKKSVIERLRENSVDLLTEDIKYIRDAIRDDNDPGLQNRYNELIIKILNCYVEKKEDEIRKIRNTGKIVKNQLAWIYNEECECSLINKILQEKFFVADKQIADYLARKHLHIIELNIERFMLDENYSIKADMKIPKNPLDEYKKWENITSYIFDSVENEIKTSILYDLYQGCFSNKTLFQMYCHNCIEDLMRNHLWAVFKEDEYQSDYQSVFARILEDKNFNDYYAQILRDNLISYNNFGADELIKMLNRENHEYLLVYLIIYYSIYKLRFDWDYINIDVLRTLWKECSELRKDSEKIIERIKKSNIEHRFSDDMYEVLVEYLGVPLTGNLLDKIYMDNRLDMFYIAMIKVCVLKQDYMFYDDEINLETQVSLVIDVAKHEELLKYNEVKKMVAHMQYRCFCNLKDVPQELLNSLRTLLLSNVYLSDEIYNDERTKYINYMSIGKYTLIKLGDVNEDNEARKKIIRNAYISSNSSVEEYLELLDRECRICGYNLNYVQKERMKAYLINII